MAFIWLAKCQATSPTESERISSQKVLLSILQGNILNKLKDSLVSFKLEPYLLTRSFNVGISRAKNNTPSREDCSNAGRRVAFRLWNRVSDPVIYINEECPKFDISKCHGASCSSTRDKLQLVAPFYDLEDCPDLRDWALNLMSCWITYRGMSQDPELTPQCAVEFCKMFLAEQKSPGISAPFIGRSSLQICDLFQWVAGTLPSHNWYSQQVLEGRLGRRAVTSMIMGVSGLDIPKGVCRYRFWNIAMSTPRGSIELIALKSLLQNFRLTDRHHDRHEDCTVQSCLQNDENTTAIPQLHLCSAPNDCRTIQFEINDVNQFSRLEYGATAWSILTGQPTLGSKRYMAISHVWSNGTGIGLGGPGNVNQCLVHHFKNIAMDPKINCDGIWWDTISLPTKKDQKVKALSKMNFNYQMAACTLVHDLELADFTWAEDGSPCLALAFSTWFSRGWTALELYMSKTVWVLFRDSGGKLLLKDLDRDILTCPNNPFAHLAHRAISAIIRRLRPMHSCICQGKECSDSSDRSKKPMRVHELLGVLKVRYTCWPRDRSIIAGLMASEWLGVSDWFDSTWSQTTITKQILTLSKKLNPDTLFHDRVPICESGPWSWCSPMIFDLGDSQLDSAGQLDIEGGKLSGAWIVVTLLEGDEQRLKPYASHDLLAARIMAAFQNWKDHVLLSPILRDLNSQEVPFVLVKTLGGREYRFVGIVTGSVVKGLNPHKYRNLTLT